MRTLRIIGVTAAIALGIAGSAQAACNPSCLGRKITTLTHKLSSQQSQISSQQGQISGLQGKVSGLTSLVGGIGAGLGTTNANVSALTTTVGAVNTAFAHLTSCLKEAPVTQYGDPAGSQGYVYDNGGEFDTTGLDITQTGDNIGGWFLLDGCNTTTTASARRAGSTAPTAIAPHTTLAPAVAKHKG